MAGPRWAVFLDRDGTLNEEIGYIRDVADLRLIPGVGAAVRRLNQAGIPAILISNQAGAARGFYPESHIGALHKRLVTLLAAEGAHLDALYYCPHLAEAVVPEYAKACDCRKPEPGMIRQAAAEHGIDLARSYMIGDKDVDVLVANNAGCRGILLRTGYGGTHEAEIAGVAAHVADDLPAAIDWILAEAAREAAPARS